MATSEELPMLLMRTAKAMHHEVVRLQPEGSPASRMTAIHGMAVRFFDAHPDATTAELAHHLGITRQSASEVVAALDEAGIVERRPHPADGRARAVGLTPKGVEKLAESRRRWNAVEREWAQRAGADDLAVVRRALLSYLEGVAERTPDPDAATPPEKEPA